MEPFPIISVFSKSQVLFSLLSHWSPQGRLPVTYCVGRGLGGLSLDYSLPKCELTAPKVPDPQVRILRGGGSNPSAGKELNGRK